MIARHTYRHAQRRRFSHILGLTLGLLATATPVFSADDTSPVLSARIYHRLAHLQPDLDAGRLNETREQLESLLPTTRDGNRYDRAVLLQLLGQVQTRLEQPDQAIAAFEAADALGVLPPDESLRLHRELARLYVIKNRYTDAVDTLEGLSEQDQDSRLLLAQSYLQLARYREAQTPLKRLIRDSQAPEKRWYEALFFAQHAAQDTREAVTTMQTLIKLHPDHSIYWRQLSALHYESGQADRALAVLEAAYQQGALTESTDDLLNLVSLYHAQDAPYKAAGLLERLLNEQRLIDQIKYREQLIDLWLAAHDTGRAAQSLAELINLSPTPQRWLRLGKLHIEQRDWASAARALQSALKADATDGDRLSTDQLADTWYCLGVVAFENEHTEDAHSALLRASTFTATRTSAQQWLRYLEAVQ